jgi:ABC-type Fe3+-hydroxamate transport system substrate-binding protein
VSRRLAKVIAGREIDNGNESVLLRVISLCPSLTELVFDLGAGTELIGRTKFCVHPSDGVAAVEKVGGTKNPKTDRIIALAPDVVLMNEEENRQEDAGLLRGAGINCHVSFPRTVEETAHMVRNIAGILDRRPSGEVIAREIEARASRVREASAGRPPVRYVYLIWRRPWMVAAGDTFASALLALAGGANAFASPASRYPEVTAAEIAAAKPDVVFFSSEPFPFTEAHAAELSGETGIPSSRMMFVDGEYITWHGSRTPAGIDYAESVIVAARGSG